MSQAAINPELLKSWRQCRFLQSASRLRDLPRGPAEVAVAGRSNAGKSSALNALAEQGALARTSKTPGRTQLINYFELPQLGCLTDLPGYGYAKAPVSVQKVWTALIEAYFQHRKELCGVLMIVDVRRGLGELDTQLLSYVQARELPVHVLLSKADKLSRGAAKQVLQASRRQLQSDGHASGSVQLFSAPKRQGVDEARAAVADLLQASGA